MWAYCNIKHKLKGNLEDFRLLKVEKKNINECYSKTLKKYVLKNYFVLNGVHDDVN